MAMETFTTGKNRNYKQFDSKECIEIPPTEEFLRTLSF
jgi:hypothetical protein